MGRGPLDVIFVFSAVFRGPLYAFRGPLYAFRWPLYAFLGL